MYLCTLKLDTGFVREKTRYIKEKDGNLVPGTWIIKAPEDDWYDYKNNQWANLHVESEGLESYYVWIPRYVYRKIENERMDVKFVDLNNNYINAENEKLTNWETLQKIGYQLPEAFTWGDDGKTQLPGYWMSKYQLSDLTENDTYTIDFGTTATPSTITIKDIKTNTTKGIAKYQYALNGKILYTSDKPENYTIRDLTKGNKTINVTLLDAKGQIIGSMTKFYAVADVNEPDLTGFDKDTTFYVYWDENGVEHNEIPINQNPPAEWYDYGIRSWANIVTRNNGLETYLTWIPRYQYTLDNVSKRSYVRFFKGVGTQTEPGYQIPEAFTWGDNGNIQIKGYWMTKHQISNDENPRMTAELSAGTNVIRVKNIGGASMTGSLKFEYYINGKKVHEGTNKNENYVYTGLEPDKTYTVNIIARNASTNAYIAAVTQKIETIGGNAPVLKGFKEDRTYYVTYDENGNNMKVGNKIKNDGSNAPKDWYDYSVKKWANIVVTDGTVENGKITGATSTSYFTWIPRYQYSLDTVNKRSNVKLMSGTGTQTQAGYKIPEAFTWGESTKKQLPGFWMSKYQISNANSILQANETAGVTANLNNWIKNMRQMQASGGALGLTDTINANLTSSNKNFDVHMQKNTEYGAVALLSASAYGNSNTITDGQTTTGNASGVVVKLNEEWVAAGRSDTSVANMKNAVGRYWDNYGTGNGSNSKNGDAMAETNGWHGSTGNNWLRHHCGVNATASAYNGAMGECAFVRSRASSIFTFSGFSYYCTHTGSYGYTGRSPRCAFHGGIGDAAWHCGSCEREGYFTKAHYARAVIVSGAGI